MSRNKCIPIVVKVLIITVMSSDFVPIVPYKTDSVLVGIGKKSESLHSKVSTLTVDFQDKDTMLSWKRSRSTFLTEIRLRTTGSEQFQRRAAIPFLPTTCPLIRRVYFATMLIISLYPLLSMDLTPLNALMRIMIS